MPLYWRLSQRKKDSYAIFFQCPLIRNILFVRNTKSSQFFRHLNLFNSSSLIHLWIFTEAIFFIGHFIIIGKDRIFHQYVTIPIILRKAEREYERESVRERVSWGEVVEVSWGWWGEVVEVKVKVLLGYIPN